MIGLYTDTYLHVPVYVTRRTALAAAAAMATTMITTYSRLTFLLPSFILKPAQEFVGYFIKIGITQDILLCIDKKGKYQQEVLGRTTPPLSFDMIQTT
jgi:hypothetical protein